MIKSRPAIIVAIIIISLASGTTQALKCFSCVDSSTAPNPACRVYTFEPNNRTFVGVQKPNAQVSITLTSSNGSVTFNSSDFDCSNACAVYTSAAQSLTVRSCYIKANIQAAFPDVQMQYCHKDYCNTSPMFPDTPPPSWSSSLRCYVCFDSVQFGSSVVGCDDPDFQPAQIPYQGYGVYFEIGTVIIPPAYFNCSSCEVVKIPSIGLTVRACSTTYDLANLGYSDVQTQSCHSDYCNGYPLITDNNPNKVLHCYICIDAPKNRASDPSCSDPYFNSSNLLIQTPSGSLDLFGTHLNGKNFNCSAACATYKIPSLSLTFRSCYINYDLTLLGYPDITAQYCTTDRCNKPSHAASSLQIDLYTRIGLIVAAVLSAMFIS